MKLSSDEAEKRYVRILRPAFKSFKVVRSVDGLGHTQWTVKMNGSKRSGSSRREALSRAYAYALYNALIPKGSFFESKEDEYVAALKKAFRRVKVERTLGRKGFMVWIVKMNGHSRMGNSRREALLRAYMYAKEIGIVKKP